MNLPFVHASAAPLFRLEGLRDAEGSLIATCRSYTPFPGQLVELVVIEVFRF